MESENSIKGSDFTDNDMSDDSTSSEYCPVQRGRGRGKRARRGLAATPRGRNRSSRGGATGRGARRGRRGGHQGPNRQELALRAREERQTHIEECISNMEIEGLRTALRLVCAKQPSFALDILEAMESRDPEQPRPGSSTAPSWCICTYCREMPTDREKLCCGKTKQNCISRLSDFYTVVLDELVIEVAMRYHNDVLTEPRDDNINRSRRHAAYRQYIMWIHGRLGAGHRKVIPSCCVWQIRDNFPEVSGQYVGFLEGVMD